MGKRKDEQRARAEMYGSRADKIVDDYAMLVGDEFIDRRTKERVCDCVAIFSARLPSTGRAPIYNPSIFESDGDKPSPIVVLDKFPTHSKALAVLLSFYKVPRSVHDVVGWLRQQAKTEENLRKLGFVFRTSGGVKKQYTFKKEGKDWREILGYNIPAQHNIPNNLLDAPHKRKFAKILRESVCVFTGSRRGIEADHRIPVMACEEMGIPHAILTNEKVDSGEWMEEFQPVSTAANQRKRESCNKCLAGDEIPLSSPTMEPFKQFFKKRWDGNCDGCLWNDYRNLFPLLGKR